MENILNEWLKNKRLPSFFLLEGLVGLFALTTLLLLATPKLLQLQKNLTTIRQQVTCAKILQEGSEAYLKGVELESGWRDGKAFKMVYEETKWTAFWQGKVVGFEELP